MQSKITKSLSVVAVSSLLIGSASAASISYDGGNGNWDKTTSNWNGGTTAFTDGDDVTFNNIAGGIVTATEALSANSIIYSSSSNTSVISLDDEADRNAGSIRPGLGSISGPASLLVNGTGRLAFNDQAGGSRVQMANTFTGGTTIDSGTLRINLAHNNNPLGTGDITLNGGTLFLWRVNMDNTLTINGGSLYASNGFGNTWNGTITLNANLDCFNHFNLICNGVIDGTGGIDKSGPNNLTLAGTNTYTGSTSVTDGTLKIDTPDSLGAGDLIINGGIVDLNYVGTKIVNALTLGEAPATGSGTYGSTASDADFKDDIYFSGTGTVTFGDATTYDGWASRVFPSGLSLTDTTPSLDFDGGGLPTAVEWVVGGDPTDQSDDAGLAPTVSEDGTYLIFTYLRADVAANSNTIIAAEYGSDLVGWTDAQDQVDGVIITVTDGDPIDTVEVKIPKSLAGPGSKLFARLNVNVAAVQ